MTTKSLLSKWKEMPVTVIAFANATLMTTAVHMFGFQNTNEDSSISSQDGEDVALESLVQSPEKTTASSSRPPPVTPDDDEEGFKPEIILPKIHINGKGENSGMKKIELIKEIEVLAGKDKVPKGHMSVVKLRVCQEAAHAAHCNKFGKEEHD